MNEMLLAFGMLISSQCTVTSYQSLKSQTDSSPFHTSISEKVGTDVVAVSEDLLCRRAKIRTGKNSFILCNRGMLCNEKTKIHYKDWVYVDTVGFKRVLDIMNPRHRKHFDVWVRNYSEEKAFGTKKLKVYLIRRILK